MSLNSFGIFCFFFFRLTRHVALFSAWKSYKFGFKIAKLIFFHKPLIKIEVKNISLMLLLQTCLLRLQIISVVL